MDKFSKIRQILILILALNWIVAFSKIVYGLITKCASMSADGIHSFGDGASNVIGLVGIWAASKPKDENHPYGHKKFETFATIGIAIMLFLAAIEILREAVSRIFHPVNPDVTTFSFALMFFTIIINIAVVGYERRKGRELSSDILMCDALHTKSDIFASLVVIGTLISIRVGFAFLDTVVASLLAIFIARSGFQILKSSSNVLCDGNVLARSRITAVVNGVPGVSSIHNVRTRGRDDDIHVDLHVMTDASMPVEDAHNLAHKIDSTLKAKIAGITEVSVHMEPNR